MVPAPIVTRLRELLTGRADVRLALLFGSYAAGRETPQSDVDLAVSGSVDRLALAAELGAALGLEVQVIALDDPTIPLLRELVDTSTVVHEAHYGAGASWRTRALCQLETDGPWFRRMRDAWLARVAERGL
ncbi:MAG: nucleotidyltransferase domain-containing protein [Polyangiaceae bacterium]|nr:nucleotidyltransferase domain-containing protein [Polyangiaceae bacterium]